MRVITGKARGIQLKTPQGMLTRPTADRVKEALFSIIRFDVANARILDLFGGTGQLGIEALSQGAKSAVFVDAREEACARFPWVETLLRPYILAVQTVPVASFIVIALLWLSSRRISAFIAFLMVLPVLYANALQGIRGADRQLLEMARVFRLSGLRRVRCIILPSLAPYLKSACHVALGLCWKAGVAAEVMAVANRSVGGMLYDAKVYLEISDLFAWTVLLVAVSILFEKAFLWLLDLCMNRAIRWEGRYGDSERF